MCLKKGGIYGQNSYEHTEMKNWALIYSYTFAFVSIKFWKVMIPQHTTKDIAVFLKFGNLCGV